MDTFGKPTSVSLASFDPITYGYDTHGRMNAITWGNRASSIAYNTNGYVLSLTDFMNRTTSFTYDNAGRVLTQTLPDTRVIAFTYDSNGNLTSVTPPGKPAHSFTWNGFDLAATFVPPSLTGNPPVTTTYAYNNDKQLTQITRPDSAVVGFSYDTTGGQLNSVSTPQGTTSYTYSDGRLATALSPDAIYDQFAHAGTLVTSDTVSNYNSGASLGSISFAYNSDLLRSSSSVIDASLNASAVNFTYDNDNLLTGAGGETLDRDANTGLLTSTTVGQISDSLTYDTHHGEMSAYEATFTPPSPGTPTTLMSQTYARDSSGRITTLVDTRGASTHTYVYTFDSTGRLTDVTKDGSAYSHYDYDSNSNRTSGNVGGVSFSASYDSQDRLTAYNAYTYTYNLNGELATKTDTVTSDVTTYTFDALGNLTSVALPSSTTVSYLHDGLGRRQAKQVGSSISEQYLYEDSLRIGAVLDGSGNLTHRMIYGSKSNVPDYEVISGTTYKVISDPNGSVRLVVDAGSGTIAEEITYDEFGKILTDTNPGFQPFAFAGCLYDQDTKLCHFGAREYEPETGRWISKDPIRFRGGDTNLYGYVLQDPINFADPSGKLIGLDDALYVASAIVVTGAVIGAANGIVNYQSSHSLSSALNAFGNGFVSGAASAGAAILTAALAEGTLIAAGVATAVDLGFSFLTAPTSVPDTSGGAFPNGVKALTNPQINTCSGN